MANSFYLDASALAKRYGLEEGSVLVDKIFVQVPPQRLCILNIGLGEVVSVLVRKRNAGIISQPSFDQAMARFEAEIVDGADIMRMPVTRRLVTSSFPLITAHSINVTDALVLKSALAIARRLRRGGDDLVLVASDQRLLRAAQAEALTTFDPEAQNESALAQLVRT